MRKMSIIAVGLMFLLSSAFAAEVSKVAVGEADVQNEVVVVPIMLDNVTAMAGMELPLEYSEGAVLNEVTFEGTRSEGFDLKVAKIDAENNRVVIALIPMVYGEKSQLEAGSGVIANMHFTVADPELKQLEIVPVEDMPNHSLMFVQSTQSELIASKPEFDDIKIELVTSGGPTVPLAFALHQNYPNPFNPTTVVMYDLDVASHVNLEIFNVLGQKVSTLVDEFQQEGHHAVQWGGNDDSGAPVATGVYFYRINAGTSKVETKKMMLLK